MTNLEKKRRKEGKERKRNLCEFWKSTSEPPVLENPESLYTYTFRSECVRVYAYRNEVGHLLIIAAMFSNNNNNKRKSTGEGGRRKGGVGQELKKAK